MVAPVLKNRRILVVEDEYLIAMDLEITLQSAQATVLRPAGRVRAGLDLVAREPDIYAAILDVNIGGETVYPVADVLLKRTVPFLFATGERLDTIPQHFAGVTVCQKPASPEDLVQCIAHLLCPEQDNASA